MAHRLIRSSEAIAAVLSCFAGPAAAGPWNRPAGEGLVIVDYTLGTGTDYFDGRGRLAPARAYAKSELAAYVEYCDRQDLMAVAGIMRDLTGLRDP